LRAALFASTASETCQRSTRTDLAETHRIVPTGSLDKDRVPSFELGRTKFYLMLGDPGSMPLSEVLQ
jgi:hypothetical protein